jgi:hypothetical protein
LLANCRLLIAIFSKSYMVNPHPWALQEYSYFIRPYQSRIRSIMDAPISQKCLVHRAAVAPR